ncbi:MAG: GNAT family N-acetyltransferase [Paracoccaceae bacterium]
MNSPLLQSRAFVRAMAHLSTPVQERRLWRGRRLDGRCVLQTRRWYGLGHVRLISRGPVCRDPADRLHWLHDLLDGGPPTVVNGDHLCTRDLRDLGLFPLMTGASLARVSLGPVADMRARLHQKWRNRLVKGTHSGLQVRLSRLPPDPDHWLLRAEAQQQIQRKYRNLPAPLIAAFAAANPRDALICEALHNGTPVAGQVILRHGTMATYQVGVTTATGRRHHAHRILLWHAMQHLAEDGVDALELGIVDSQTAPGLARFKLGTGAQVVTLGGTWLYHRALRSVAYRVPLRLAA